MGHVNGGLKRRIADAVSDIVMLLLMQSDSPRLHSFRNYVQSHYFCYVDGVGHFIDYECNTMSITSKLVIKAYMGRGDGVVRQEDIDSAKEMAEKLYREQLYKIRFEALSNGKYIAKVYKDDRLLYRFLVKILLFFDYRVPIGEYVEKDYAEARKNLAKIERMISGRPGVLAYRLHIFRFNYTIEGYAIRRRRYSFVPSAVVVYEM